MVKIIKPNLSNSEIEFNSDVMFYDVDERVGMVLSHLIALNESTQSTRMIRCDASGNLLTSSEGVASERVETSTSNITSSPTLLVSPRSNRKQVLIRNVGGENVYIGKDNTVSTTNGFLLDVDSVVTLTNFVGMLYGIVGNMSSEVRVMELV